MKLRIYFTLHHSPSDFYIKKTDIFGKKYQKTAKQMDFPESTAVKDAEKSVYDQYGRRGSEGSKTGSKSHAKQFAVISGTTIFDESKEPEKLEGFKATEQFLPLSMRPNIPKHL